MKKESVNPSETQAFVMKEQMKLNQFAGKNPQMSPQMYQTGAYGAINGENAGNFGKKLFSGIGPDYPIK